MTYSEFKQAVMANAAAQGLEEYDLFYSESNAASAVMLKQGIRSYLTNASRGACFRCIYHGKPGYAATELFTAEQAEELVAAAMENAASIESDDQVFIHGVGDTYRQLAEKSLRTPTGAQLIEKATDTLNACFAASDRLTDASEAEVEYLQTKVALCNSKGLDLQAENACSTLVAAAVVNEGEDAYFGVDYTCDDFDALQPRQLAKKAVDQVLSKIGADSVESGKYTVVISNETMCSLLATYCGVFSAAQMQRGLSLLKGKEGTAIASPLVTLVDDPFYADSLVQMPFDHEGVAAYTKKVIDNGIFQTPLHNLTTAAKAGCKSTGNGAKGGYAAPVGIAPFTFYIAKGEGGDLAQMLEQAHDGLYITSLDGLHAGANAISGDFSLLAGGYRITDGKRGSAVHNITISGNFFDLLREICLIGDDLRLSQPSGFTCFGSPCVMVKNMSIAGK